MLALAWRAHSPWKFALGTHEFVLARTATRDSRRVIMHIGAAFGWCFRRLPACVIWIDTWAGLLAGTRKKRRRDGAPRKMISYQERNLESCAASSTAECGDAFQPIADAPAKKWLPTDPLQGLRREGPRSANVAAVFVVLVGMLQPIATANAQQNSTATPLNGSPHQELGFGASVDAPLNLLVDKTTGHLTITNPSTGTTYDVNGYEVLSPLGTLSPGGWRVPEGWNKSGGASPMGILAGSFLGSILLPPGDQLGLGQAYDLGVFADDLTFRIHNSAGGLSIGTVEYVASAGVTGDYNGNGVVDAADYTVWRAYLDTPFQLANEGGGATPGTVTQEDYDTWKSNFGMVAGAGLGVGQSVPEPGAALLALFAAAPLLFARHRRLIQR